MQYYSQTSTQSSESDSILIFKMNASGSLIWQQYYHNSYIRKCSELAVTNAGDLLVSGSRQLTQNSKSDATVLRFNGAGSFISEKVFSSTGNNAFNDLWPTSDGNFLFCSLASDTLFNDYAFIVKTNANGDSLWTRHLFIVNRPGNHPSYVQSIIELNNNDVLIAGSYGTASYNQAFC